MAHIERRGEGKYLVRVSRGSGDGRRFINKTVRGTRKEAAAFAREIEMRLDAEERFHSSGAGRKVTITEFANAWQAFYERHLADPAVRDALEQIMADKARHVDLRPAN